MRRLTSLLTTITLALTGAAASAETPCTAGDALLEAGDFAGAVTRYEADIARPACADVVGLLRINEAYAREQLARQTDRPADYCAALYAYRRAQKHASPTAADAMKPSLEDMGDRCELPGWVSIRCEPAGATLQIAGLGAARPCPTRYGPLAPGAYEGVATAAGTERPFEFTVAAGETAEVLVELRPERRPAPALIDPPPPPPDRGLAPYAWTSLALAAASAGVTAYAVYENSATEDEIEALNAERTSDARAWSTLSPDQREGEESDYRARGATAESRYATLHDDHERAQTTALVGAIAAGVFTAAAVTFFVLDAQPTDPTATVEVAPSGVRVRF